MATTTCPQRPPTLCAKEGCTPATSPAWTRMAISTLSTEEELIKPGGYQVWPRESRRGRSAAYPKVRKPVWLEFPIPTVVKRSKHGLSSSQVKNCHRRGYQGVVQRQTCQVRDNLYVEFPHIVAQDHRGQDPPPRVSPPAQRGRKPA